MPWHNLLPDPFPMLWNAAGTGNTTYPKDQVISLFRYLGDHPDEQDRVFTLTTRYWVITRDGVRGLAIDRQSERFYDIVLEEVHEWERTTGQQLHKGTLYYFLGVICLLKGNIEKGLLAMHQAAAEDFRGGATAAPAIHFIHLDDRVQEQFFRPYIQKGTEYLQSILHAYRQDRNGTFSIEEVRIRLLANPAKKEYAWYFASLVYRLQARTEIASHLNNNPLGSYLGTSLLFDICRLFEVLLSSAYTGKLLPKLRAFIQDLPNDCLLEGEIGKLNALMSDEHTSESTIRRLLDRTFSDPEITMHGALAHDIALAYSFRNFSGHAIADQPILRTDFERIARSLMNALLVCIEFLPPHNTQP